MNETHLGEGLSILELLDALKRKIHLDILRHESTVQELARLLRSKYNAARIINTLPWEILSYIFTFVQSDSDVFPPLLRLHVCSHWRHVALSTPALWSHLFLPKPPHQEAYGKRFLARRWRLQVLYTVYLNVDNGVFDYHTRSVRLSPFFQQLKTEHSKRLKEFIWDLLVDMDSPSLEYLSLDLSPWNFVSTDSQQSLPAIFGGSLPALKRLSLSDVITWPSHRFDCLTHLWLHRLDVGSFLREILEPWPSVELPASPGCTALTFPRLQHIEINDFEANQDIWTPHHLLQLMSFPKTCIVQLTSDGIFRDSSIPTLRYGSGDPVLPTTAVFRAVVNRTTDLVVVQENAIHIRSPGALIMTISLSRRLLLNTTRLVVCTPEVVDLWGSITVIAPKVEEVVFTNTSGSEVKSGFNWVIIVEAIKGGAFVGSLARVYLPPMAPITRLKAAERALAKEFESKGENVIEA
ncbi:hypothetical protein DFP72DRAFT_904763 [Ephemerocybe angulata]|uniref:F-box domain-containing protein n=1 Tax=Ephemerocybe angulata TaxID=980116 RepID=A0A8H6HV73_9AGAR|nr:hypothetical protein DFP72DRAFT_904763 [Tulosesus angulatus]